MDVDALELLMICMHTKTTANNEQQPQYNINITYTKRQALFYYKYIIIIVIDEKRALTVYRSLIIQFKIFNTGLPSRTMWSGNTIVADTIITNVV